MQPIRRETQILSLPDSPDMTDKVLNDPLKRLLLADQAIPPLQPVLQYRAGA